MDFGTLIGLVAGLGMLAGAIWCAAPLTAFVHLPSLMVVVGGACCAAMVSFPLDRLSGILEVARKALASTNRSDGEVIEQLAALAEVARRDGVFALEQHSRKIEDPFLVQGLHMVVDGVEPDLIESTLMGHVESMEARHAEGRALFETIGRFAPAFGMIGTLIGLVIMLRDMRDPSNLGPALAMALLTTLYGVVLANLIALPLAGKLGRRSAQEVHQKTMMVRGLRAIQSGDSPRLLRQKLDILVADRTGVMKAA